MAELAKRLSPKSLDFLRNRSGKAASPEAATAGVSEVPRAAEVPVRKGKPMGTTKHKTEPQPASLEALPFAARVRFGLDGAPVSLAPASTFAQEVRPASPPSVQPFSITSTLTPPLS